LRVPEILAGGIRSVIMPGIVPGIHVLAASRTWMAGSGPAVTLQ
jgi:hypothetical protein